MLALLAQFTKRLKFTRLWSNSPGCGGTTCFSNTLHLNHVAHMLYMFKKVCFIALGNQEYRMGIGHPWGEYQNRLLGLGAKHFPICPTALTETRRQSGLKEAGGRREEDNTKEDVMMNTNDLEDGDEWQPMNMKYHTFPLATAAFPHRVVLMSVKSSWVRYVRKPSMLLQPDSQTILCREAFSQRSHYTEQLLHTDVLHTKKNLRA